MLSAILLPSLLGSAAPGLMPRWIIHRPVHVAKATALRVSRAWNPERVASPPLSQDPLDFPWVYPLSPAARLASGDLRFAPGHSRALDFQSIYRYTYRRSRGITEDLDLRGWLTIDEAAERSGFSRAWITRLLGSGRLRGQRIHGRAWLVSSRALDEYTANPPAMGRPKKPPK